MSNKLDDATDKSPALAKLINDLLTELDQLADSNVDFARRVTAAKAALQDTTVLEEAIRDGKAQSQDLTWRGSYSDVDDLPDRQGRASSCIIPPPLELRIAVGTDALTPATSWLDTPSSAYPSDPGPPELEGRSSSRYRAMTLPDIHKPLPPTPTTPWPLASPTSASALIKLKGLLLPSNLSASNVSSFDGEALLLHNITYEERPSTQLPFVPGQSYTWLPRRQTSEEVPCLPRPPTLDTDPSVLNPTARLPEVLPEVLPRADLESRIEPTVSNDSEGGTQTNSSPTRSLRKRFEDYLIPRGILVPKPTHERSRTLSPSRTPRLLAKRAKSTHDLRRKASKGVRFADR